MTKLRELQEKLEKANIESILLKRRISETSNEVLDLLQKTYPLLGDRWVWAHSDHDESDFMISDTENKLTLWINPYNSEPLLCKKGDFEEIPFFVINALWKQYRDSQE